jgi:hypothetical protein
VHEPTGIAAIGEDAGDEGEALAGRLERQLAAVAVLDIGAMDADGEQPTIGVGQDVAPFDFAQESLAPGDLLPRVIAFFAPF